MASNGPSSGLLFESYHRLISHVLLQWLMKSILFTLHSLLPTSSPLPTNFIPTFCGITGNLSCLYELLYFKKFLHYLYNTINPHFYVNIFPSFRIKEILVVVVCTTLLFSSVHLSNKTNSSWFCHFNSQKKNLILTCSTPFQPLRPF